MVDPSDLLIAKLASHAMLDGRRYARALVSEQSMGLPTRAEMLVIERKRGSRARSIPRDAAV